MYPHLKPRMSVDSASDSGVISLDTLERPRRIRNPAHNEIGSEAAPVICYADMTSSSQYAITTSCSSK